MTYAGVFDFEIDAQFVSVVITHARTQHLLAARTFIGRALQSDGLAPSELELRYRDRECSCVRDGIQSMQMTHFTALQIAIDRLNGLHNDRLWLGRRSWIGCDSVSDVHLMTEHVLHHNRGAVCLNEQAESATEQS